MQHRVHVIVKLEKYAFEIMQNLTTRAREYPSAVPVWLPKYTDNLCLLKTSVELFELEFFLSGSTVSGDLHAVFLLWSRCLE